MAPLVVKSGLCAWASWTCPNPPIHLQFQVPKWKCHQEAGHVPVVCPSVGWGDVAQAEAPVWNIAAPQGANPWLKCEIPKGKSSNQRCNGPAGCLTRAFKQKAWGEKALLDSLPDPLFLFQCVFLVYIGASLASIL